MGLTLVIALLGTLFGGGIGFLIGGGVAAWVATLIGIVVFLTVFAAGLQANDDTGAGSTVFVFVIALVVGALFYYLGGQIVNWTFNQVHTGVQNEWLLAIVGGLLSDILLGILGGVAGFIIALAGGFSSNFYSNFGRRF